MHRTSRLIPPRPSDQTMDLEAAFRARPNRIAEVDPAEPDH